jgi:hypothetical protein
VNIGERNEELERMYIRRKQKMGVPRLSDWENVELIKYQSSWFGEVQLMGI